MTTDQQLVLNALYEVEAARFNQSQFDGWATPAEIAEQLPTSVPHYGDPVWARHILEELWIARKVLQTPADEAPCDLEEVWLRDIDAFGGTDCRIPVENNDCRGPDAHGWERVARYAETVPVRYRSRVAEIARLLSFNLQRF